MRCHTTFSCNLKCQATLCQHGFVVTMIPVTSWKLEITGKGRVAWRKDNHNEYDGTKYLSKYSHVSDFPPLIDLRRIIHSNVHYNIYSTPPLQQQWQQLVANWLFLTNPKPKGSNCMESDKCNKEIKSAWSNNIYSTKMWRKSHKVSIIVLFSFGVCMGGWVRGRLSFAFAHSSYCIPIISYHQINLFWQAELP